MPKITDSYATERFMDWYAIQNPEKQEAIILSLKVIARQNRTGRHGPLFSDEREVANGAPIIAEGTAGAEPMTADDS